MSLHESEWDRIVDELRRSPEGTHVLQPPASGELIRQAEAELGPMPEQMRAVLSRFNGAELFDRTGPMFTVFGIGIDDWPSYWDVVAQTKGLRETFDLPNGWAFGVWNYGSVWVVDSAGLVAEWDSAMCVWSLEKLPLLAKFQAMMQEGAEFLTSD